MTPKDVRGPQLSKVDLMKEIQEKNQQINSLTGRVDALESNHQKKIEEMKTAHEVQMAEMKESHQQDMAKIEDAHHKDMATVGDKIELLTKLVLHQRPHEMHLSGMHHWLVFLFFGLVFLITFSVFLLLSTLTPHPNLLYTLTIFLLSSASPPHSIFTFSV